MALARDEDDEDDGEDSSSDDEDDDDLSDGLDAVLRRNQEGKLHRPKPGMVVDGKWELRGQLGSGSFGQVYEACHVKLDRAAAIKILDPKHGDPQMLKRFEEEARLQAQMESKHLVRVTDCGVLPDGSPYFVMDLVKGTSLRKLQRPLELERALELAENMLAGLAELHQRGVTHGDIKPENVMVGEDGEARLTDFGLARTFADEPAAVAGTPLYMAPEMLLGDKPASASARTDVYAAGVVMYELLTGKLPRGRLEMDKKRVRAELEADRRVHPVRTAMKEIPAAELHDGMEALDKLVMDAVARDPAMRPKSAVPMLAELQRLRRKLSPEALLPTLEPESGTAKSQAEVRTTQPFKAVEAGKRAVPRWVLGVAAVVVLGVVMALAWGGGRDASEAAELAEATTAESKGVSPAVAGLSAEDLVDAHGGILVAAGEDTAAEAYQAFCAALGGDGPRVEGVLPVVCRRVPAMDAERLLVLAEQAGARVVVSVRGDRVEVRATSHHRGNPLLARLDGLELPAEPSRLAEVVPVLRVVMGASQVSEVELPRLEWTKVGARWGVLTEWVRLQQGHLAHEDLVHREQLERALEGMLAEARKRGDGVAVAQFYRDLAVYMRASSVGCDAAEPALRELSTRGEHEAAVQVWAILGLVPCLLAGDDAAAKADEAAALLVKALEASGDPCVNVAEIGSMSWIDHWRGNDALWEAHAAHVSVSECEPAVVSEAFSARGDALVASKRWSDAASAYARAYGSLATRVEPLLAWVEYDWLARPQRASRKELLEALQVALAAKYFEQAEQRVSLAYMRWWLTREPADAQRVVDAYATVKVGDTGLIEGVASDLEPEICKGAKGDACSRRILAQAKQAGDDAKLRRSLAVR